MEDLDMNLLRVSDACKALACGRTRLHELIKCGKIRAVKIGQRGIRIPVTEIERFIREQMEGAGE
jgi:excisionase family DNA binding protein